MTKKVYCPPSTQRLEVMLESGICAASKEDVVKDEDDNVTIDEQDLGGGFDASGWD